jgi:PAS domain S-box-containing protein
MMPEEYELRIKELELEVSNLVAHNNVAALQKEISLRQAIENSIPSGIAVVDDKGKQVYVNRAFCKLVGWNEDELLGKTPPYLYWPKNKIEDINNAFKQTLDNSAPSEGFDLLFCHKNGKMINVNVIISPLVQEKNKLFYLANVLDISDRKKTEKELKESQALLKYSVESQKDTIIFSIDLNYDYLYFNKAHVDAMKFAYNQDIDTGINFLDCISSLDDRRTLKGNIDRALTGESHSIIQMFGETNIAHYEVYFNPIINEKNEIIGCASLARNITERKESEQALKDSETKFREIINQINDIIIVFDETGKIIIWNRGAENFTGLKAETALNRSIADVQYQFTPAKYKDKEKIEDIITGILTFKTPERFNQILDSEMISLDSEQPKNIQSIVFPIRLNGYYLFCTVIRDVTEIKRYEKELIKLSADKDKFYSVIAQYLYTPFSLFSNFSKLMAEELDTLPLKEIQKMAVLMSKSATNLFSLLDNMLQWTRMNQGKITFEPQKLNLKKISLEAISILNQHAEEKNIKINQLMPDDIIVIADIFMLKTILRNLVSNAIKYTSPDGQIDISTWKTEKEVIFSVLDNGVGITPGYITSIFNISEIHSRLGTGEEKGTTLGLLLCKEFVEKHKGQIWVEKTNGNGTEIRFTIPLHIEMN